jgi:hypothetical protein
MRLGAHGISMLVNFAIMHIATKVKSPIYSALKIVSEPWRVTIYNAGERARLITGTCTLSMRWPVTSVFTEGSAYGPVHHWGRAPCHPGPLYQAVSENCQTPATQVIDCSLCYRMASSTNAPGLEQQDPEHVLPPSYKFVQVAICQLYALTLFALTLLTHHICCCYDLSRCLVTVSLLICTDLPQLPRTPAHRIGTDTLCI